MIIIQKLIGFFVVIRLLTKTSEEYCQRDNLQHKHLFLFDDQVRKDTFIGWVRRIDEKNPLRIEINHFWVFTSPNSIPRAMINKIERPTNTRQSPYATNIHHQGKVNEDFPFILFWSASLGLKTIDRSTFRLEFCQPLQLWFDFVQSLT